MNLVLPLPTVVDPVSQPVKSTQNTSLPPPPVELRSKDPNKDAQFDLYVDKGFGNFGVGKKEVSWKKFEKALNYIEVLLASDGSLSPSNIEELRSNENKAWRGTLKEIALRLKTNGHLENDNINDMLDKLKGDPDFKTKIQESIEEIRNSSNFKAESEAANEDYDGRVKTVGNMAAMWAGGKVVSSVASNVASQVAAQGLGKMAIAKMVGGKIAGLLGPVGMVISGLMFADYLLENTIPDYKTGKQDLLDGLGHNLSKWF